MKAKVLFITAIFMFAVGVEALMAQKKSDEAQKYALSPLPYRVDNLEIKNLSGDVVTLPYYGEKHLLIFYVDPDKHKQNEDFTYEIEENHAAAGENIQGYGILNLKDTIYPNSIVRMLARKRTEKNGATVLSDEDNIVSKQWGLGDCNNKFVLLLVSKEGELVFCRKGEFSEQDKKDFYEIIEKYR